MTRGGDAFDRIIAVLRRLPGAAGLEQSLAHRPRLRRWVWFATIYVVSVIVFGAVALFLNAIVPK
jgi:hypothetical protein